MGLNRPQANERHDELILNMVGTRWPTKHFGDIVVLEYNSCRNVIVQFVNTKAIKRTSMNYIRTGILKDDTNIRVKLIYGVGYSGQGKYSKTSHNSIYNKWIGMLSRCYDLKSLQREPAYIGCSVCEEWHNFQKFAEWYEQNIYSNRDDIMLDKDILVKGNKIYSPSTCILVPADVNKLFVSRKNHRGLWPIGVYETENHHFVASLGNKYGFKKYLGCFLSSTDAFYAYKAAKEQLIRYVANLYKNEISPQAYKSLMNYEIEITD